MVQKSRALIRQDHTVISALTLGVLASLFNTILYLALPDLQLPLGTIFLLLSALCLGVRGALVAAGIGILPEIFLVGDHVYGLRLMVLTTVLAFGRKRAPTLPPYVTTLGLWIAIFGPAITVLNASDLTARHMTIHEIFIAGFGETLLTMMASALLLNNSIWSIIARSARPINAHEIITTVVTILATTILFIAFLLSGNAITQILSGPSPAGALLVGLSSASIILLVGLTAWRLATYLADNAQALFARDLLRNMQGESFSGLSSDYWRRHTSTSIRHPALRTQVDGSMLTATTTPDLRGTTGQLDQGIISVLRDGLSDQTGK